MVYDKPITIEQMDAKTEQWSEYATAHARVNKTKGNEYSNAGAERYQATLTFELRYSKKLEAIRSNTQLYRLIYRGGVYNIIDYDDFMEKHRTIKLTGVLI